MKYICICIIKLYQATLSKVLPPACRFTPSCSRYAVTALERFGILKGGCLALSRIIRCNPFCKGGYDPVPDEQLTIDN
ncbi:MAG: membrane protein insertion efficiency factor YidD [Oscillospiraceae bacterium]|nr:membrane protein insertion efficiency factor YidD [Oscillospiraceae bacterium]